jgi:NAD+ diphosphatase
VEESCDVSAEPAPAYRLYGELPLARAAVDRAAHRRNDEAWLDGAWASGATRVLLVADGQAPVEDGHLVFVAPDEAPDGDRYLLGEQGGVAYFAVRLPGPHPDSRAAGLRHAGAVLDDRDAGLLVEAIALANWHATHGFCPRCGEPTEVAEAGHVRRCPADRSLHFPRTDPAVIMLVTDPDDRALLGRAPSWPEDRYSTLAGFVEPGETPEQAVVREVGEESGIVVETVAYAGSQPWPFPSSLMLAYFASAAGGEPRPDQDEIIDVRWFTRDELADAIASGAIHVPPSVSVSRRLIEGWYGKPLPQRLA